MAAKLFNGKSMGHWKREAGKIVMECLVRSAGTLDQRSIIGRLAADRLTFLAVEENPDLYKEMCERRDRYHKNIAAFLRIFSISRPASRPKRKVKP